MSDGEPLETSDGTDADSTDSGEIAEGEGITTGEDVVVGGTKDEWSAPGMTMEGGT